MGVSIMAADTSGASCSICLNSRKDPRATIKPEGPLPANVDGKTHRRVSKCSRHPSENTSFYCVTCREMACRNCIAYDRKHSQPPCDYKQIEEVARTARERLRPLVQSLHCKKAEVQEACEGIEKMKRRIEENREKNESRITEYYERLLRALETRKERMIQQLHNGSQAHLLEIEAWQGEAPCVLSRIQSIEDTVELSSDEQLLAHQLTLLSEIADIKLKALPVEVTQEIVPESISFDEIMRKLEHYLPMYQAVDPKHSTTHFDRTLQINIAAHAYVTLRDSTGFPCWSKQQIKMEFKSPFGDTVAVRVTPLSSSRYLACYTPTLHTRGCCELTIEVNGQKLLASPFSIFVQCPPDQLCQRIHTIKDIRARGCLKALGKRVFCVTRSDSGKPCAIYIEGGRERRTAFDLTPSAQCRVQQWAPDEIAISKESNSLYISDSHNHMVHRFTLDEGTYISSTGKQGSQNGQFDRPNGLCVAPDGSLYVCDSENHRIQVFDRDLNFLHTFGAVGMDRGEFNWPSNVAITSDGNVYVTELNNHRIQCLSRSGDHVRFIGRPGYGETELGRPNILHIHDSHIFVSDDRGVVVFTLSGQFVTRFANELSKVGDYPIEGLTVSSDGFVYVYGCSRNEIFIY